jgi:hypothetical protein
MGNLQGIAGMRRSRESRRYSRGIATMGGKTSAEIYILLGDREMTKAAAVRARVGIA